MATATAYYSVNMETAQTWYGNVTVASSSQIQITLGGYVQNYYGNFTYSGNYLSGGTITSSNYYEFGTKVYQITGSNYNALTVANYIDYGNITGLFNYIFSGSDKFYGSSQNDTFHAYNGNDSLYGKDGDDYLYGGDGNDKLNGGNGADTLIGGTGKDTYYVNTSSDLIVEGANAGYDTVISTTSFTLGANIEKLNLTGSQNLSGSGNQLDNIILGNGGKNTLQGYGGNDKLDGKAGADIMIGGTGNDTYIISNAGDRVTEYVGEGNDVVISTVSHTLALNVEKLILSGTSNIDGFGNVQNNTLIGNDKVNRLDGGGGADRLKGAKGNDIYYIDNAGDVIIEKASQGFDTVKSSIDYILGNNLERLKLLGSSDIDGTGNKHINLIYGNHGENTLKGGSNNDKLTGFGGDDYLKGGSGNDKVYGNSGEDIIVGGPGNDLLYGGIGSDILSGGGGNDILSGDDGNDTAKYDLSVNGVVVNLNIATAQNTIGSGTDTLNSIENLVGSDSNDKLTGNTTNNELSGGLGDDKIWGGDGEDLLIGGRGNDILSGQNGDDILNGGSGSDTIKGGSGEDTFILNSLDGSDTVIDFVIGTDHFDLDSTVFNGLTVINNQLDASSFVSANVLNFADVLAGPSILYENSTGDIYFDENGGSAIDSILIVSVTDGLAITNNDFDLS